MSASDFLPPDGMTLEAAGDALLAALVLRAAGASDVDRTFYDTFDGLVYAAQASVVHEHGRLMLVGWGAGEERAGIDAAQPAKPLLVTELEPGPLREALEPIVGVRALLPLVHVHSRMRALAVLDGERKTIVRMTLEEPAVVSSTSRYTPLRPRVRLAAVRGYDKPLHHVRRKLEHELGFKAADQPLVDEAVRAAGGAPGGTSSKINVPLSADQRADAAAVAVLQRLLQVIVANIEGTIADVDSEFLHDLRVSVRRSRAVVRELKRVFPSSELARFGAELRWIQQVTGDSRDLDVYVLEFDDYRNMLSETTRSDLDPLLGVLERRRLTARREMVLALRSERATALWSDWAWFLEQLVELDADHAGPDAARAIDSVAAERISRVYRRMLKMGGVIDGQSPPEAYHELRKKGKELRYLLELFGAPLYPEEIVKPMIKALKSLQDVLGRHQDREVQVATLRSLRDEVSGLPGGPAALMAMGVLIERLTEDERATREEFAERFAAFASPSERKLVKETFA